MNTEIQFRPHLKNLFTKGLFLFFCAVLAGCSSVGEIVQTPEQIVTERAQARWLAVIAGKWETAYSFATPAFRAAVDLESFANRLRGSATRKSVEVKSAACAETTCDVVLELAFEPAIKRGYGLLKTDLTERWVKEEGRWYIYLRY